MLPVLVLCGLAAAVLIAVFAVGLRAARTRVLSLWGIVPAGCTIGAAGFSLIGGPSDLAARIALSMVSIAGGIAHGVVFSIVALPAKRTWLRIVVVPLGMWTGTFAAMWFAVPYRGPFLFWLVLLLASGTLTAWMLLPFWSKNHGFVQHGPRRVPSVRFPCPRCGTRVDWSLGAAPCTDCGLRMTIHWPADDVHAAEGHPKVLRPRRFVRFSCPSCGHAGDWPRGDSACPGCALKVSLYWNEHGAAALPGKKPRPRLRRP